MKKDNKDLRSEYSREDLAEGSRGKYYSDYKRSHNIVLLEPEVAKVFPDECAVNQALLSLIKIAQTSVQNKDPD